MKDTSAKQDFRKQILSFHYELSDGNPLRPVLRTQVAERLGLGDAKYNDQELLSAISYLESKGLLAACTNMEDTITDYGIDEVEHCFPNLPGGLRSTDALNPLVAEMDALLKKINEAELMCRQGLLETYPLAELHYEVEKEMARLTLSLEEIWQLKCKKITRVLRNQPRHGFCTNPEEASKTFAPWKELITEVVESLTGDKPRVAESYVSSGTPYSARKLLRDILRCAKTEIAVIDNYLHADLIAVIESALQDDQSIKLRFLTSDLPSNRNLSGFKTDYRLLKQQYVSADIRAKTNQSCHGRFLIIDRQYVYHSGHSFHDLGKKGDHVNRIDDTTSIANFLKDFDSWWSTGTDIT